MAQECSVDSCGHKAVKRSWCQTHYARWHRHGDPTMRVIEDHGKAKTPEYKVWRSMKARCDNPNEKYYYLYGGRGIRVCDRWYRSFTNFLSDMGSKESGMSLDRIDNDKGYEPSNCRWVTAKEQANNRRDTILVARSGRTQSLKQWCEELSINYGTIWSRVHKLNWACEQALVTPIRKRG